MKSKYDSVVDKDCKLQALMEKKSKESKLSLLQTNGVEILKNISKTEPMERKKVKIEIPEEEKISKLYIIKLRSWTYQSIDENP